MISPCGCVRRRQTASGLTLVESLICLALAAALAVMAAPGMRDAIALQRVASVRSELGAALQWARWEAVRRNATVSLSRRTDCDVALSTPDDWHCGWDVVARPAEPSSEILQRFDLPRGVRIAHQGGGASLPFSRYGQPAQVAHKFVIGPPATTPLGIGATPHTTTLCMNRTGRVRTVEGRTTC